MCSPARMSCLVSFTLFAFQLALAFKIAANLELALVAFYLPFVFFLFFFRVLRTTHRTHAALNFFLEATTKFYSLCERFNNHARHRTIHQVPLHFFCSVLLPPNPKSHESLIDAICRSMGSFGLTCVTGRG